MPLLALADRAASSAARLTDIGRGRTSGLKFIAVDPLPIYPNFDHAAVGRSFDGRSSTGLECRHCWETAKWWTAIRRWSNAGVQHVCHCGPKVNRYGDIWWMYGDPNTNQWGSKVVQLHLTWATEIQKWAKTDRMWSIVHDIGGP